MIWCWKVGVEKYWMKTSGWRGGGEGECRIYVFVYLDLCVYLCLYLYLRICDCVSELMTTSCLRGGGCVRGCGLVPPPGMSLRPVAALPPMVGQLRARQHLPRKRGERPATKLTETKLARQGNSKEKSSTEIGDWNLGNKNSPEGKIAQYLRSKPTRCLFSNKILKQI